MGGIFLFTLSFSRSRTWGRDQLSPMKLANSACPVREWSTTVALTPLSARAMAACLVISQDMGLLLVESYTNHLARRQNTNVCHWARGRDHHALKERGWKVLFTHSYQYSRQAKKENGSHKCELIGTAQQERGEALVEETSSRAMKFQNRQIPRLTAHTRPLRQSMVCSMRSRGVTVAIYLPIAIQKREKMYTALPENLNTVWGWSNSCGSFFDDAPINSIFFKESWASQSINLTKII